MQLDRILCLGNNLRIHLQETFTNAGRNGEKAMCCSSIEFSADQTGCPGNNFRIHLQETVEDTFTNAQWRKGNVHIVQLNRILCRPGCLPRKAEDKRSSSPPAALVHKAKHCITGEEKYSSETGVGIWDRGGDKTSSHPPSAPLKKFIWQRIPRVANGKESKSF